MKLATKLAIGYIVTLLLVGTLSFVAIGVSTRAATATAGDLASRLAQEMMRRINYGIYLKLDELRSIASSPVVRQSVLNGSRGNGGSSSSSDGGSTVGDSVSAFLESSLIEHYERSRGYRLFHAGRISDTEGTTIVMVGQETSLLELEQGMFNDLLVSSAAYDPDTGVNGIPIHVAIRSGSGGRRVGRLHVVLSLTALTREIELATTKTVGSRVELMQDDGSVLYATLPFRFFTEADNASELERMDGEYGYFIQQDRPQPTLTAYARSTGYSSFGGLDWVLVLSQPLEAVTERSRVVRNVMVLVSGVIVLAVLAVSYIVARTITRPIERLRRGVGALAAGDLSHRVDLESSDEIGELSQAFDDMAARLQSLYAELEDFAYIVSHDVREPLRGIRYYTQRLDEEYGSVFTEEGREHLDSLRRLSDRLDGLVEALLRYSRAGREALSFESVDLNDIVIEIREDLSVLLAERKGEVRLATPLPSEECYRTSVREILQNLVTNAIKYNDSETPLCEVGHFRQDDETVYFVKDNGIGIPAESREEVFRIFRRLHGREAYGGGTGSGLTIVKRLVERHNGRIWVDSIEGQGSTFYFTLGSAAATATDQHGTE